jgi:hypothetical protein
MIKRRQGKLQVVIASGGINFHIGEPVSSELDAQRILKAALMAFGRL